MEEWKVSYAIVGIAFLLLIVSVMGGIAVHDHGIKVAATTAQKSADEAAVVASQKNTATCKAANVSLQESIGPITKERDEQSAKVKELDRLWREAGELMETWRARFYGLQASNAKGQKDAHAKGQRAPDPTQTCQQVMDEMDADGKQFATEREARMRDLLGLPAKLEPAPKMRIGK